MFSISRYRIASVSIFLLLVSSCFLSDEGNSISLSGGSSEGGLLLSTLLPVTDASALRSIVIDGNDRDLVDGSFIPIDEKTLTGSGTQAARRYHQGGFGADSRCGLDGIVVKVTNLNDSGPGSLRQAVGLNLPRTVVFEVSGVIRLKSPLIIESPFISIAGQTAPIPGITLQHSTLRVHTHDVCIQHLRVRHGDLHANKQVFNNYEAQSADAIIIRSDPKKNQHVTNVVLDNLSVSWSIDENISIYGGVSNVTIRDSIIAEPLMFNAHNINHGYCLLIRDNAERISVIGNIFAHCQRRSPRMDGGTLQYVNNLVYNPGEYAIHSHDDIHMAMVGNLLEFPRNIETRWKSEGAQEFFASRSERSRVYSLANIFPDDKLLYQRREGGKSVDVQSTPTVWEGSVNVFEPAGLRHHLIRWAGAFPVSRDVHDKRVISSILKGLGGYIDSQTQIGGYGFLEENHRPLTPPSDLSGDSDNNGISDLIDWLQSYVQTIE